MLTECAHDEFAPSPIYWALFAIKLDILAYKLDLEQLSEKLHSALFWRLDFAKIESVDQDPVSLFSVSFPLLHSYYSILS